MRSLVLHSLNQQRVSRVLNRFAVSENQEDNLIAVDQFLRSKFIYSSEEIETLQSPDYMLSNLDNYERLVGDCDDITTLHATILKLLGFQVRFTSIRSVRTNPNFDHVYLEVFTDGKWIPFDITIPQGTTIEYFAKLTVEV